jgi:hypothetical protein
VISKASYNYNPTNYNFNRKLLPISILRKTCWKSNGLESTDQVGVHAWFFGRKMLDLQHQYNNCTTIPYMRVGPTYWSSPSCKMLLYSCCISVVQESNPFLESHANEMIFLSRWNLFASHYLHFVSGILFSFCNLQ